MPTLIYNPSLPFGFLEGPNGSIVKPAPGEYGKAQSAYIRSKAIPPPALSVASQPSAPPPQAALTSLALQHSAPLPQAAPASLAPAPPSNLIFNPSLPSGFAEGPNRSIVPLPLNVQPNILVQPNAPPSAPASQPAPIDKRLPGESILDFTNRQETGGFNLASGKAVETSEALRSRLKKEIMDELSPSSKLPALPLTADERIRLRREQGTINDEQELADLRNEARTASEEMRVFRSKASERVTEAGRLGAVSEAERNLSFRRESLAIREQALVERLNSKNAYINQAIQDQQFDYGAALQRWNAEFSVAAKVNELVNTHLDQVQKDALTVVTTISNLMKDTKVPFSLWPIEMQSQVETAAMRVGLPKDLFKAAFSNLKKDEKIITTHIQDNPQGGRDVYAVTQDAGGEIGLMRVGGIPKELVAAKTDTGEFYRMMSLGIQMAEFTGDSKWLSWGASGMLQAKGDQILTPEGATKIPKGVTLEGDGSLRTVRHNNPIAVSDADPEFISVLSKNNIPFSIGSPFPFSEISPGNNKFHTIAFPNPEAGWEGARTLLGGSPKALSWYLNRTGKEALGSYNVKTNEDFNRLTTRQQDDVIMGIFKSENGSAGSPSVPKTQIAMHGTLPSKRTPTPSSDSFAGARINQEISAKKREEYFTAAQKQNELIKEKRITKEEAIENLNAIYPEIATSEWGNLLEKAPDDLRAKALLAGLDTAEQEVDEFKKLFARVRQRYPIGPIWGRMFNFLAGEGGGIPLLSSIRGDFLDLRNLRVPPLLAGMFPEVNLLVQNMGGLASSLGQTIGIINPQLGAGVRTPTFYQDLEYKNLPSIMDTVGIAEQKFKSIYDRIERRRKQIKTGGVTPQTLIVE